MSNEYKTVSLDPCRVKTIDSLEYGKTVVKQTSIAELVNLGIANDVMLSDPQIEWRGMNYNIRVPKIYSYNEIGTLQIEHMEGRNLEEILATTSGGKRGEYLELVKDFFNWMENYGFFWRGAAPRNILINQNSKTISLLDFERPITFSEGGFTHSEFVQRLVGLVHEEFCAFLSKDEQEDIFPDIWQYKNSRPIPTDSIRSTRVKLLLTEFYGPIGDTIDSNNLGNVYMFMSSIVTPYVVNGETFFPLQHIDNISKKPEDYVRTVLALSKLERDSWPEYFKNGII